MRRTFILLLAATRLALPAPLHAHDDRPKPVADLQIVPDGTRLTIAARVPLVALKDANLPLETDRLIERADIERSLQLAARDLALGLDLMQNGTSVPFPLTAARLSDDATAADFTLTYVIQPDDGPLSARLRRFPALPDPVPIRARYVLPSGRTREFTVAGPPELVTFNPRLADALRRFARRGAEVVLDGGTAFLFALVMVFRPHRRNERMLRLAAAWLGPMTLAALAGLALPMSTQGTALALGAAASAIVIGALAGLIGATPRWTMALAVLFGVAQGIGLGLLYAGSTAHAGDHAFAGFLAFLFTVLLAQMWLVLLLTVVHDALERRHLPMRAVSIALLVYACHGALHLVTDEAAVFAAATTWSVNQILFVLAIGWVTGSILSGAAFGTRASRSLT